MCEIYDPYIYMIRSRLKNKYNMRGIDLGKLIHSSYALYLNGEISCVIPHWKGENYSPSA